MYVCICNAITSSEAAGSGSVLVAIEKKGGKIKCGKCVEQADTKSHRG